MNELQGTLHCRPLLARKGEARPSPAGALGSIAESAAVENPRPARPRPEAAANDLSLLIRHRDFSRRDPEGLAAGRGETELSRLLHEAPPRAHMEPGPTRPARASAWESAAPSREEAGRLSTTRRQLTLRLPLSEFRRLDGVAKATGRTYQNLLAEAAADYLDRRNRANREQRLPGPGFGQRPMAPL